MNLGDPAPPAAGAVVGTVKVLAHFPVKSTAGEALSGATLDDRGLEHDRRWAVYTDDGGIASGKTTRRFRKVDGLMHWRARMPLGGLHQLPILTSPDGCDYRVDDPAAAAALSDAFGQPLTLRPESSVRHHDESGVHLVTTSALRAVEAVVEDAVDAWRLRPNLVLDTSASGHVEDGWTGAMLAVGPEVVLRVGPGMPRCVMVDQPQAGVPEGPPVLKSLGRTRDLLLGAQASVMRPGTVRVGDVARLIVE